MSAKDRLLHYEVRSPVLLLIFNRPDVTLRVFEQVKKARPHKLYIAADGPRKSHATDAERCAMARSIIEKIDWECEHQLLFRKENLGCKVAVSTAISWFFEHEEEGIILEDDCLPVQSFFYFCDSLLEYYRLDSRICTITGTNLQQGKRWGKADYYFSQFSNIWGWATWRRFWNKYDPSLQNYDDAEAATQLEKVFSDMFLKQAFLDIFRKLKAGEMDTWDFQLQFITFFENGLCATPNVNLISNIGFREDATHTNNPSQHAWHAELPTGEITGIMHPQYFLPEKEADYFFLKKEFYLEDKWRKLEKDKLLRRRLKKWVKGLFK